ncbi:copper chaperone PCu(A)C [Sphingomonas qilianensis]|uniref:copper chaperone PCu(A)C n=1 Tax=Sphingomonas qilianensis TaxID=1736690 RepID=UPI0036D284E2
MPVFFPMLVPVVLLAACSPPAKLDADHGYVRLAAVKGNPAAAYFTLHGGATDATLISVGSTVAIRAEMHQTMQAGSTASMKPIGQVKVPAKATVTFAPGGRHVMLFNMNPGIKRGSIVPLVFQFSNGVRFERKALAIAAGDPPPED